MYKYIYICTHIYIYIYLAIIAHEVLHIDFLRSFARKRGAKRWERLSLERVYIYTICIYIYICTYIYMYTWPSSRMRVLHIDLLRSFARKRGAKRWERLSLERGYIYTIYIYIYVHIYIYIPGHHRAWGPARRLSSLLRAKTRCEATRATYPRARQRAPPGKGSRRASSGSRSRAACGPSAACLQSRPPMWETLRLYICIYNYLSIYIYLSIYLSISLSLSLSIYIYIYIAAAEVEPRVARPRRATSRGHLSGEYVFTDG